MFVSQRITRSDYSGRHQSSEEKFIRNVHTVCVTVLNFEEMRNFLRLSGTRLEPRDKALLSTAHTTLTLG